MRPTGKCQLLFFHTAASITHFNVSDESRSLGELSWLQPRRLSQKWGAGRHPVLHEGKLAERGPLPLPGQLKSCQTRTFVRTFRLNFSCQTCSLFFFRSWNCLALPVPAQTIPTAAPRATALTSSRSSTPVPSSSKTCARAPRPSWSWRRDCSDFTTTSTAPKRCLLARGRLWRSAGAKPRRPPSGSVSLE